MSKIENEKVEVNSSKELNDLDILNDILQCEKNISTNLSIGISEMSNKVLFKKVFKMFKSTKGIVRELYDLGFSKGWYTLETANETNINKELESAKDMFKEL